MYISLYVGENFINMTFFFFSLMIIISILRVSLNFLSRDQFHFVINLIMGWTGSDFYCVEEKEYQV